MKLSIKNKNIMIGNNYMIKSYDFLITKKEISHNYIHIWLLVADLRDIKTFLNSNNL